MKFDYNRQDVVFPEKKMFEIVNKGQRDLHSYKRLRDFGSDELKKLNKVLFFFLFFFFSILTFTERLDYITEIPSRSILTF